MGERLLLYSTYVVNGIVRQVYNLMKLCDMLNPQVFISIYYYQFVLCVVHGGDGEIVRGWAKIRGFPKWMQTLVINLIILRVFQSTVGDEIPLCCCCWSLEKSFPCQQMNDPHEEYLSCISIEV